MSTKGQDETVWSPSPVEYIRLSQREEDLIDYTCVGLLGLLEFHSSAWHRWNNKSIDWDCGNQPICCYVYWWGIKWRYRWENAYTQSGTEMMMWGSNDKAITRNIQLYCTRNALQLIPIGRLWISDYVPKHIFHLMWYIVKRNLTIFIDKL